MIHFEKRLNPSRITTVLTPIIAVILTMIAGGIMFAALGKPPLEAIRIIFWDPLFDPNFASYSRPQLLVKAGPLILIAIGLSIGFKAGIWNIGAEGQYIMGAIFGAAVDIHECLQLACKCGNGIKKFACVFDCHVEDFMNIFSLVTYLQSFAVVTFAMTHIARPIDVCQEMHFDLY